MNYQIGDFIIRLKNAAKAHKKGVVADYSNINKAIGKVLIKEGFLHDIKEETVEGKKVLLATLRYQKRKPVITDVRVVSKPSLRVYEGSKNIFKYQGRETTVILSTNSGILTGKEAIKKGVGGELLFKIW